MKIGERVGVFGIAYTTTTPVYYPDFYRFLTVKNDWREHGNDDKKLCYHGA
jgi:hypothetical protein